VMAHVFAIEAELPAAKAQIRALAARLTPERRAGDFAQALMDLGATICTPKKPACAICPWSPQCTARRRGDQDTFPRKAAKAEGRLRRGAAFWVMRMGAEALLRTRPASGLLGGMTEVPTSAWTHDFDETTALDQAPTICPPPANAEWRKLPGIVTHTFTHFPLELVVYAARVPAAAPTPAGTRWVALNGLADEALPSLMRKVIAHATDAA